MTARTVNGSVLRGTFHKALAGSVTLELRERLADAGVDLSRPLAAHYPYATWLKAMEITAGELFPGERQDEALKQLGRRIVLGLKEHGVIKGPFLTMARLLGPRRALREVAHRTSADSAWLRIHFKEQGPRAVTLLLNDGRIAELFAGAIEPLVEMVGGKRPCVEARIHGLHGCELDISWS